MSKLCSLGREYDEAHVTCISCQRQQIDLCHGVLAAKKPKHGNAKVEIDGIVFDSKREGARYVELRIMERAGVISGLKLQVAFVLQDSVVLDGRKKPALRYVADFVYLQDSVRVIEDAKSPHLRKHPTYRAKKHLMASVLGLSIREV